MYVYVTMASRSMSKTCMIIINYVHGIQCIAMIIYHHDSIMVPDIYMLVYRITPMLVMGACTCTLNMIA